MKSAKIERFVMRNATRLCGAIFLLIACTAKSEPVNQREGWGIGLMLGYPLGLNAKNWLGGPNAWDIGIGAGPGFRIHGDYEWGLAQVLTNKTDLTLDLYLGLGGGIAFGSGYCGFYGDRFCADRVFGGARVPFGFDFRLRRAPVNFGLELAPGIWVGNYVTGLLDVFLFVRFLL